MDNPYAFDGQDSNWRTEIDLATALGSLSTGAPSTEEPGPASPPGASTSSPIAAPASPPSPRPQRPPPSAPPPSEIAPRKPPQQPGVVAGMIDSIFRNVMLSAEANDLADGLDGLHVGGGSASATRPPSKRTGALQWRPSAAVKKERRRGATPPPRVPTPPRAALPDTQLPVVGDVVERSPPAILPRAHHSSPTKVADEGRRESDCVYVS